MDMRYSRKLFQFYVLGGRGAFSLRWPKGQPALWKPLYVLARNPRLEVASSANYAASPTSKQPLLSREQHDERISLAITGCRGIIPLPAEGVLKNATGEPMQQYS